MALTVSKAKLKTSFIYVPTAEKMEDRPFKVHFEAIPLDSLAELQDAAIRVSKEGEYSISINTLNYAVIKEALIGWENVESDAGVVQFKRDHKGATDNTLALIPGDIRSELATIIVEVSKDLPNAEEYLEQLDRLSKEAYEEAREDEAEDEPAEVVEEVKAKPKARAKKA